MYFKFACPSCGKNLKVREEDGGRRARCPYCKTQVAVPKFAPAEVPEARPRHRDATDELAAASAAARGAAIGVRRSEAAIDEHTPRPTEPTAAGGATDTLAQSGSDGTNVSMLTTAAIGGVATGLFYAALIPIWNTYYGEIFWDRGLVTYFAVFLTAWSFAILVLKHRKMNRQRDAMLFDLLPTEIADDITVADVPKFTRHIRSLPADPGQSFLINRVLRGLEHFRVRRSNPEVANLLSSQSDIDANAVHSSYALVKIFTWAIPILGFIGTVIGISDAVGGFSSTMEAASDIGALKGELGKVTTGLGVAFDTTLVALVLSLLVAIPTTALRKSEDDLLNGVDEYCNENLLKRLNDDEGQIAAAESSKAIRKAIEQAMTAHHAELASWTKKLESIGGTLTDEVVKGWTKVFGEIDKSQTAQSASHREQLAQLQEAITRITERTGRVERETSEHMRDAAESLRGHFGAMTEGIAALNRVLGDLGERHVTVQGGGRVRGRGWWPFGRRNSSNGG